MNIRVQTLNCDQQFAVNLAALCAREAMQGLKLISTFVAPGTNVVILVFG